MTGTWTTTKSPQPQYWPTTVTLTSTSSSGKVQSNSVKNLLSTTGDCTFTVSKLAYTKNGVTYGLDPALTASQLTGSLLWPAAAKKSTGSRQ